LVFEIVDLPGNLLGLAQGPTIHVDADAAGQGWWVDETAWDDREFRAPDAFGDLAAREDGPAYGRVDLLTVVLHELGHTLGYGHGDHGVMQDELPVGTRRMWLEMGSAEDDDFHL
jgi:hypothetical protein